MSATGTQESDPGNPVGTVDSVDNAKAVDKFEAVDKVKESRFVVVVGGQTAELVYSIDGDRLTLVHTGVPQSLNGRGLGGMLVAASLKKAADNGYTIVPVCPFATAWLRKHEDEVRGVPIDWPPG